MDTIYLDFDNTIVESNKQIIKMINQRYNTSKTEDDLVDYGYKSIYPLTQEEIVSMYEDDAFFCDLQLKPFVLEMINKYLGKYKIIITSKGTSINLEKKKRWINMFLPKGLEFIGINKEGLSKSSVDMKGQIQIDDVGACLDTNASLKILYKSNNNFIWQQVEPDTEIVVANDWEQIDEILSFYNRYDYETLNLKKEI